MYINVSFSLVECLARSGYWGKKRVNNNGKKKTKTLLRTDNSILEDRPILSDLRKRLLKI